MENVAGFIGMNNLFAVPTQGKKRRFGNNVDSRVEFTGEIF